MIAGVLDGSALHDVRLSLAQRDRPTLHNPRYQIVSAIRDYDQFCPGTRKLLVQ